MRHDRMVGVLVGLVIVLLASAGANLAFSVSTYDLSWWTIDGGGGTSEGGDYALRGTIGQPDTWNMGGGVYELAGGFWGGVRGTYRVYLPLILRNA